MKKLLLVFGTRPEAIKMLPVYLELKESSVFDVKIVVTAQHREMLDQVLNFFGVLPNIDLNLMKNRQSLHELTSDSLLALQKIFEIERPNLVLTHGDTTTTLSASLAAFYSRIPIGHIEAGLRTYNFDSPFPEEMNRQITDLITKYYFAPTDKAKQNLLNEGKDSHSIIVTGNTVIDALLSSVEIVRRPDRNYQIQKIIARYPKRKIILMTGHRRENFGEAFLRICESLKKIAKTEPVHIIYPVHLNPNVQEPVKRILSKIENISLIEPLDYEQFLYLMDKSFIVLTDSGGIQEEAPSLGKPVLLLRDTTERPEALEFGTVKLVGTDTKLIVSETKKLLNNIEEYKKMSEASNPYGDGRASERIRNFLEKEFLFQ